MRCLGLLFVAACVDQPPRGAPEPPGGDPGDPGDPLCARIRADLPDALDEAGTPGALLVLRRAGSSPCVVAAGLADVDRGTDADVAQPFHIGSMTKTFIAAAALRLADRGVFDGKDRVADWLPALPVANREELLITHLLTNTSGIPNYMAVLGEYPEPMDQPTTPEHLVAISQRWSPRFAPGARFDYSNTNWIILGMILERATGKPWGDVVRDELLVPLGLEQTYLDLRAVPASPPMMRGYVLSGAARLDATELAHPTWADAAGSMVSTIDDLGRWTEALYTGDVLSPQARDTMLRPLVAIAAETSIGYSLGAVTKPTPYGDWVGHGGDWAGARTYLGSLPSRSFHVVAATNQLDADRFVIADVAWTAAVGGGLGTLAPWVPR